MSKILNLKYTFGGLLFAGVIGYTLSSFTKLPFWAGFSITIIAMVINGYIAEYEDNLPGGFNNPMSPEEIKIEKAKLRKKWLPFRISFWVVFILGTIGVAWLFKS